MAFHIQLLFTRLGHDGLSLWYLLPGLAGFALICVLLPNISLSYQRLTDHQFLIQSIYRFYFHPLAKIPGYFLPKISSWPLYLHARNGDRHLQDTRAHQEFGNLVRTAPNEVSINTVAALKQIYANRVANVKKSEWYETVDSPAGAYSLQSEPDREKHARRRRIIEQAFSANALKSVEYLILKCIRLWCDNLMSCAEDTEPSMGEWSPPRQMNQWSTNLNYDIMGELAFGQSFHCITSSENRFVPKMAMNSQKLMYSLGFHPFIFVIRPLIKIFRPLLAYPRLLSFVDQKVRDLACLFEYTDAQIAQKIATEQEFIKSGQKNPRKDFAHYLVMAKDPLSGEGFTDNEIRAESSALIQAGGDTAAITLAATFFYLLADRGDALSKLIAEIRRAFSEVEEIRLGSKLSGLVFLHAVIDETLRLSPAAPSHLPREVLPGGLIVDGVYFPAGVVVGTSAYAIHHNPEYYPDPYSFRPERWIVQGEPNSEGLGGVSEEEVTAARAAFCPFSLGPRGCLGKRLVYIELTLILARSLWLFDVTKADTGPSGRGDESHEHWGRRRPNEYQLVDQFVAQRSGPTVRFRHRSI